jgi:Uma2 family endonuclease
MSSAAKRFLPNYTVADYQAWEGDWELIDGLAVSMSPSPTGGHQTAVARLVQLFLNEIDRVGCGCHVMVEVDWIVDNHTVVRPDMVIVCGEVPERHVESPPRVVVEVLSPSTAQHDRTFKFDLYQEQGVEYYLIFDSKSKAIEVFELQEGKLAALPRGNSFVFNIHEDCRLGVDFGKLLS